MTQQVSKSRFDIRRVWELRICTCCSNSYLLETTTGEFVYLDSWDLTPLAETGMFPGSTVEAVASPAGRLLSVEFAGTPVTPEPEGLDPLGLCAFEFIDVGTFTIAELPESWHATLCRSLPS